MSKEQKAGPAHDITDPMLARATEIIEHAVAAHCRGGDMWMCAATAAQEIIGEIAQKAQHRFSDCEPGPWKRMPPELRAAIAKATGQADKGGNTK